MKTNGQRFFAFAVLLVVSTVARAATPAISVSESAGSTAFPLMTGPEVAAICTDAADAKVVQIAAGLFAEDVERVTGRKPAVRSDGAAAGPTVIVGTVGHSTLIDQLIFSGKLDVSAIKTKWEAYQLTMVDDPMPGIPRALVIAGSDRRGTAYGVFTLSEAIGVSPWYWWADVTPTHRASLYVSLPATLTDAPAVKYRGIFINDEDWGLQPWAAKTFEPEVGDIGPKTYAKVCELLLRLKANYLWPAMHPCTKAFNTYPQNKQVADDYAVVMGSSHAEPMLRDNVSEWNEKVLGPFDFTKNRDAILNYWDQRVAENGKFENVYTLGMRGIHDSSMQGGGTVAEKVARLSDILAEQRAMLARHVNADPAKVPQAFVPYKEVLPLYQGGLAVPDDVTLVWPDDNFGYVRRLSTPKEQQRPGGAGIYYHLSYWGPPEDYLWLDSTPPALVWEEMTRAYDYGARTIWVANVGDIKSIEKGATFFLSLAWNPKAYDENCQQTFLKSWSTQTFGAAAGDEIASILDEYDHLAFQVRPEHTPQAAFSWEHYGEAQARLERYARLTQRVDAVYAAIPAALKDACFELLVYPVHGAALMNEKQLCAARSRELRAQSSPEAEMFAHRANAAQRRIEADTLYYNDGVAHGKWKNVMSAKQRGETAFKPADVNSPPATRPATKSAGALPPETTPVPSGFAGFVDHDGVIAMTAEHATRRIDAGGARWTTIEGLGRNGDAITALSSSPSTATAVDAPTRETLRGVPSLQFDVFATRTGTATVLAYCLPSHAVNDGRKLRYAVSIDDQPPAVVAIDAAEFSAQWKTNVLRNAAIGRSTHDISAGQHVITVWAVDPAVVFDTLVMDWGGLQSSFLPPPENREECSLKCSMNVPSDVQR